MDRSTPPPAPGLRLAEPLAALSLVSDMARGRPPDEAMRACLVATSLARTMGVSEAATADVYYTTLLRSVGCTATSHEYAALFDGDDLAARGRGDRIDPTAPGDVIPFLWAATPGRSLAGKIRTFPTTSRKARQLFADGARADCEVGARMARRFGLGPAVESALLQVFERWDGKGPAGLAGDAIDLPSRFAAVAYALVMFEDDGPGRGGPAVRRWAGHGLDPGIVATVGDHLERTLEAARAVDPWRAVVAAEPAPVRRASERELDEVVRGFADAVDLKSPFFHGHSSGVASLAATAATALGLTDAEVTDIRRAGLLHLDGSGYHRGAPPSMQTVAMRILAAADVYHALTEDRPHRAGLSPRDAARTLEAQPLDRDAVRAVVEAAGQTAGRAPSRPAGITDRELHVLHRLVRGRSEKEIAADLVISPATVHTHVVHIYEKAGVSTRAGLAMFAMEHDLIRPGEPPRPGARID